MATIDLIVLGMLKKEALSAYDIQKLVEYRNISKWVKISTPSIYKKVIQLEEKGYISSNIVKEGKMPEKAIYSLTEAGEKQLENLMFEISAKPVQIFLDFNAVIVNLDALSPKNQMKCLTDIEANVNTKIISGRKFKSERKCTRNPTNRFIRFASTIRSCTIH